MSVIVTTKLRTAAVLISCSVLCSCTNLQPVLQKLNFLSDDPPPLHTLTPMKNAEFIDRNYMGSINEARAAYQRRDYTTTLHESYGLAHADNAEAQHLLGMMFARGEGIPRDAQQARYWFERSARHGNAESQYALGMMLWQGDYLKKDCRAALPWIEKSAQQQHAQAQYFLGRLYLTGDTDKNDDFTVAADQVAAFSWLQKAARNGYAAAQHNLAVMYQYGVGVAVDYAQSKFWYEQAARMDTPATAYDFAHFYQIQSSPFADQERSLYWLKKAALGGHIEANRELATLQKQTELGARSLVLFDSPVSITVRDDLRRAVRKQGAIALSEPEDGWFDTYDARQVWDLSDRLTIGYVLETSKVAMLQYRLPQADTPTRLASLRNVLKQRYGHATDRGDQLLIDGIYNEWQARDTRIVLSRGENRSLFLSYFVEPTYAQMTAEQLRHEQKNPTKRAPTRVY